MTLQAWLRLRLSQGWVEIDAHPGQPVHALHGPTVRRHAAAGLRLARDVIGLLDTGELLMRGVLDGAIPAPAWLVDRQTRCPSGTPSRAA